MKVTTDNIKTLLFERKPIYYATKEGIQIGLPTIVDQEASSSNVIWGYTFNGSSFYPADSRMYSAGAYYTTYSEALGHMRGEILKHVAYFNTLANNHENLLSFEPVQDISLKE